MKDLIRRKILDALATPVPRFTRRTVRLPGVPGKALAVIGPRRAGKTTFLWQVLADRLESGVPREGLLYFNFEDERLAGIAAGQLQWVVEEYYALCPEWRDKRQATFFLDEIQAVAGWERFVRRVLDTERADIFLSGSSARLLSREVATLMRGRAMEALVLPFSFREFLRHAGAEPATAPDRLTKAARSAVQKRLREYLAEGGFPEAQGLELRDRMELLRGYVDTALFRDVVERHAVSNPVALRWMVRHLLGNAAGTFSVQRFYGDLRSQGIPVAKDTLHAYLGHLEDAFLIRSLPVAADSERRRMVNPRKAYPVDPGLIPVFDRAGRANEGHALETAVALELERRGAEVAYVRTREGFEVDFLARYADGGEQLIQVCADLDAPGTRDRELRGLLTAAGEYPSATLHLMALTAAGSPPIPDNVRLHRAADWLLEA
jgi:predicted AAA+ superfamily ATPase